MVGEEAKRSPGSSDQEAEKEGRKDGRRKDLAGWRRQIQSVKLGVSRLGKRAALGGRLERSCLGERAEERML